MIRLGTLREQYKSCFVFFPYYFCNDNVLVLPHVMRHHFLMWRFQAVTSCCYLWPRQAAAPRFSLNPSWGALNFWPDQSVIFECGVLLLRCAVFLAVNCLPMFHCHYPLCSLRLYIIYSLICLSVSLSEFFAPTFNHPSITGGGVFRKASNLK